jgi:hypothetical protein
MRLVSRSIVATLALVACRSNVQPARVAPESGVVGCYAFLDGTGRSADESLYWAPATGRLDAGGRAIRLTPTLDSGRVTGPGSYRWSLNSGGDSLRVRFHNGFSGTEFILSYPARGDTLRGHARARRDYGPPFGGEAGAATAVRIACGH